MSYEKEKSLMPILNKYSTAFGVDIALILAHIKAESSFDPNVTRNEPKINDKSYGLMQILFKTASRYESINPDDLFDPETNIRIGTQIIHGNLTRYSGNMEDAIAAYNDGVARKNDAGQYVNSKGDTKVQRYVDEVMGYYDEYDNWLMSGGGLPDAGSASTDIISIIGLTTGLGLLIWFLRK